MRVRTVALVATMSLALALPAVPATATPPTTPVVHRESGVAIGNLGLSLVVDRSEAGLSDHGQYVSTGQLGRGSYRFDLTYDYSLCSDSVTSFVATGTARLVRSDGAVVAGTASEKFECNAGPGTPVRDAVAVVLTHGSRDLVGARLRFAGKRTYLATPSGDIGPEFFVFSGSSSATHRVGYWMLNPAGAVFAFGGATARGHASSPAPFTDIEPTRTGNGYWLTDADGTVFAFGDASRYGNAGGLLAGEVVTSLSSTRAGHGYWLFTSRGRVLPFGDARFYGDLRNVGLNGSVIGSVVTPTDHGYYLVASDGGVFTFGDAKFRGSMGGAHLNQPVVGLVPTADNAGYWLVAADGGVFAFRAPFRGSMGGVQLTRPVIGMVRYGAGYMMVAQDGGIFNFSDQPFFGSLGGSPFGGSIVAAAATG